MTHSSHFVVIGKTAKTGARIYQRLQQQGAAVRAVSRTSEPAFDWRQRDTWANALKGATAAYISYQPDLAIEQAADDIAAFIEVAKAQGLEHLVLLSGRGEPGAERAENLLINSGLDWNVIRAAWFAQNFSESFMAEGIVSGELVLPAGEVLEPFVDADDIAEVALRCLLDKTKRNRLFEVTGSELLSFADCVNEISRQLAKPIRYRQVSIEAYLELLQQQAVPQDLQDLLKELFTVVFDGRNAHLCDGIEQATSAKPRRFADYVAKAIATGHWQTAGV
ncbi:NmrA family NAD(P)-binding protein [Agarivorans gilvus]|uniref:NmrA family transcriptional regulator n=1 Tax=Agarivorans gilvus TaxID=680279 RepID=A0ABQ1HWL0_9ALTE|nr:NAD(P)H-binding protein [Agarivorans gilvus]GGA95076.1 NmrA family transcriptional regulator [Agarivorans gilvus]